MPLKTLDDDNAFFAAASKTCGRAKWVIIRGMHSPLQNLSMVTASDVKICFTFLLAVFKYL